MPSSNPPQEAQALLSPTESVGQSSRPGAWTPASDTESLRLNLAHHRTALKHAATLARNSVRTNSQDLEAWREDMQVLADYLERQLAS